MRIEIKKIFFFTALIYLFYSCGSGTKNTPTENISSAVDTSSRDSIPQKRKADSDNFVQPTLNVSKDSAPEISLEELKDSVVLYIKKMDFLKLSRYIHPKKGIRFF